MDRSTANNKYGNIAVGLYDIPSSPAATILYYNPIQSNAIIFGSAMSGKTVMIKNILARMNELEPYRSIERTYVLDFGGNIGDYSKLGRVCACFDNSNGENVKRIFKAVEAELNANAKILGGENYLSYQTKNPNAQLPHITLIIENATAFLAEERYENYHRMLLKLARDGLSKGVSIILTANDCAGPLVKLSVYFPKKFAFDMPGDKYTEIFGVRVDKPIRIPGRGISNVEQHFYEFQAYLPFEDEENEKKCLDALCSTELVKKIFSFPAELTWDYVNEHYSDIAKENDALLGLDYYNHSAIDLDFDEFRNIAIYGKKQSGKTNLLRLIISGIKKKYGDKAWFIFYDDSRHQLDEFKALVGEENCVFCDSIVLDPRVQPSPDKLETCVAAWFDNLNWKNDKQCFFIFQNKRIYSFLNKHMSVLGLVMGDAQDSNRHYILCDVPKIADKDISSQINSKINKAFLLDTISDFLRDRGSSSVFGSMDAADMKADYADSDIGDAFCYDVDKDELQKFKVIKMDPYVQ